MVSISLCMIVKNEENNIGNCLESVKNIADEIIIVDTGSTDKTKEIVKQYTDKIFDFEWIDDFAAARNYSFSKATKDYILWLDADDVILPADQEKFLQLKNLMSNGIDVVIMRYNLGISTDNKPVCSFPRERLLKRSLDFTWHDCVHEYLILKGNIVNMDINITHKSTKGRTSRNLDILEKHIKNGKPLSDRNKFYYARELFFNQRYTEAIEYYNQFLNTKNGLVSNYLDACLDLSYCYSLANDKENQLKALVRSFEYATPKAEACCKIGYYYKEQEENYNKAIDWFELATILKKPDGNTISVIHDFWGFIPLMELSYCNFKLGNFKKSKDYNDMAGKLKPQSPTYLKNKEILEKMLQ